MGSNISKDEEDICAAHNERSEECNDKLNSCICIRRISLALSHYQSNLFFSNKNKITGNTELVTGLNDFMQNENYSINTLLNDHIHIMERHKHNLEDIRNMIRLNCDISQCRSMMRHHSNNNHNVILHILDNIHSYIMHTFDIGYRFTKNEQLKLSVEETEETSETFLLIDRMLSQKYQHLSRLRGANRIKQNKFVTSIDVTDTKNENETIYSFGYRFYYWSKYKNLHNNDSRNIGYKYSDWYINPKYDSLKTELLCNTTLTITHQDWKYIVEKCLQHLQLKKCKKIVSNADISCRHYKIKKKTPIKLNNLISVALYTDFDMLSCKFSATYRKLNLNEPCSSLKKRHREFYHWGKLLRETVEGFGTNINNSNIESFYHGISNNMLFPSTIARFGSPTSTSLQLNVAKHFACSKGMILDLISYDNNGYYFNCSWISKFSNEDELLLIGGYKPMQFKNIIDCRNLHMNYQYDIQAINILADAIHGTSTKQYGTKKDVKRINKLIEMEYANNIDHNYIHRLFHLFCNNQKCIKIDLFWMNKDEFLHVYGYKFLGDILLYKYDMVNVYNVCRLFKNCTKIIIKNSGLQYVNFTNILMHLTTEQLKMINKNSDDCNSKLNEIVFKDATCKEKRQNLSLFLEGYRQFLDQYQWNFRLEKNQSVVLFKNA